MALRLIGTDPKTDGKNCPSVWVDEKNGDVVIQAVEITDHATLAQVATNSAILDHEKIVRLPAHMRAILREACGDGAADVR